MVKIKSTTVFSKNPFIASGEDEKNTENKKRSYWLEKLHIQRERMRKDNNRREEENTAIENDPIQLSEKSEHKEIQEGIDEHTKNTATKIEDDKEMVDDLVKKSNRSIIKITSEFPWDLFPSTIDVEESRVTFKFNQLFASQTHSVDIKDISNVFIESSFLFASLQVVSRTYIQNDIKIGNLNKKGAEKVQKIIEGLRMFAEHDINTANYEIDELITKIGEFHSSPTTE